MSDVPGGLTVTSRKLPDSVDLLSWLPAPQGALSWVRDGDGLVGWGEAARFAPRGADRFAQAHRWWSDVTARVRVDDEVDAPGSGPVAFASMAFADSPGDSVLIMPRLLVGRRDGMSWLTTVGDSRAPAPSPVASPRGVRYREGVVDDAAHRRSVAAAVARIRAGELGKVVLARDLMVEADAPLDERHLLARLAEADPACWVYAVAGLVGATPELLLRRDRETVSALLLAGTGWPRPGVAGHAELARELLASGKDRSEHEYGVRSLLESLTPFCTWTEVPAEPTVLHLSNVLHLATEVRGRLAVDTSLLELTARVHPTAAVGGWPTAVAIRVIDELEGMDRGGYLGPVGWLDGSGNGEFGVALRCAQVTGASARLFAGGGIVAGSDPDTEAAEVAAKFRAIRSALGG